jgi:hypothetical protein
MKTSPLPVKPLHNFTMTEEDAILLLQLLMLAQIEHPEFAPLLAHLERRIATSSIHVPGRN